MKITIETIDKWISKHKILTIFIVVIINLLLIVLLALFMPI